MTYIELMGRVCPRIRSERERLDCSKKDVAMALGYGLSVYASYETKTLPSLDRLVEMADYFGCSADNLLGRTDKREVVK